MVVYRNYWQAEIDILKGYYGGSDSDWIGFQLLPNDDYIQEQTPYPFKSLANQGTVLTNPYGNIYYDGDFRYYANYSQLNFSDSNSARRIHTFIHEGWHQVQSMNTSALTYIKVVGKDAHDGNYNYEEAFGSNGTQFYKLSSEQQAEFFADYYLLKHGGSSYINLSKKGGLVGIHSEAEYDAVYANAAPEGLSKLVADTVKFDNQQDHKDRYNGDRGGQAMPAGADDLDHDGATVNSSLIENILQIFKASLGFSSPLILDIDGNGVELVSLHSANAVYFNVDSSKNDGVAEATGWFSGGDGA